MERYVTIRELYHAAEAKGMLDAPIVVTGCGNMYDFKIYQFVVTDNAVKVW